MDEKKMYEFRKLCSKDIFPMFKLLNNIGIKEFKNCFQSDEIRRMISKKDGESAIETVGLSVAFDIAGIIIKNIPSCEDDIFDMLSDVSGMKRKDLEKMDMGEFFEMIVDFIKKPEFKDFIGVVSRLFK